jgi:hypothetical protein
MAAAPTAESLERDAVRGAAARLQQQLSQLESLMARGPDPVE